MESDGDSEAYPDFIKFEKETPTHVVTDSVEDPKLTLAQTVAFLVGNRVQAISDFIESGLLEQSCDSLGQAQAFHLCGLQSLLTEGVMDGLLSVHGA